MTPLFDPVPVWRPTDAGPLQVAVSPSSNADGACSGLPELIDPATAALVFSRSERTIRRWIAGGSLPAFSVGRSLFIRSDDVRRLITDGLSRQAGKVNAVPSARKAAPSTAAATPVEVYVPPD